MLPIKIRALLDHLLTGKAILFWGMDFELDSQENWFPAKKELKTLLAKEIELGDDFASESDIFQSYEQIFGRNALVRKIVSTYSNSQIKPRLLERGIAKLPVKAIITTRYDRLIEDALKEAGRQVATVVGDIDVAYADWGNLATDTDLDTPIMLIKLNGCVTRPESLIITLDDQIKLSTNISHRLRIAKFFFALYPLFFLEHHPGSREFRQLFLEATDGLAEHVRRAYAVWRNPASTDVAYWESKNLLIWDTSSTQLFDHIQQYQLAGVKHPEQEPEAINPIQTPYKFLDYFSTSDRNIFFGRETEKILVTRLVLTERITVLFGPSGSGKSSLLRAGIVPILERLGLSVRFVRFLDDPVRALLATLQMENNFVGQHEFETLLHNSIKPDERLVLVFDQFEEIFTRNETVAREKLIDLIEKITQDTQREIRILVSMREDFLPQLHEFIKKSPNFLLNSYRLMYLSKDQARLAIVEPAALVGVKWESGLVQELLERGELLEEHDKQVPPVSLQIVCYQLYKEALQRVGLLLGDAIPIGKKVEIYSALYKELGGVSQILGDYLEQVLAKMPDQYTKISRQILKVMIGSQDTKIPMSRSQLLKRYQRAYGDDLEIGAVSTTIDQLCGPEMRLLRNFEQYGDVYFEIAHERMIPHILAWFKPEELKLKEVLDLLDFEVRNWQEHDVLIEKGRLSLIRLAKIDKTHLSKEQIELVVLSALNHDQDVTYWVAQAENAGYLRELEDKLIGRWEESESKNIVNLLSRIDSEHVFEILSTWLVGKSQIETFDIIKYLTEPEQKFAFKVLRKMCNLKAITLLEKLAPDGMILIPAGKFKMGSDRSVNEQPIHNIWLDSFYISKYPVTRGDFWAFLKRNNSNDRDFWTNLGWQWKLQQDKYLGHHPQDPDRNSNHPMTQVNWFEAYAFARWKGCRLPSEAEWEKSCRGDDGRMYPWGNEFNRDLCNTSESYPGIGGGSTTPVDRYPLKSNSPYGVGDLVGNVWEWTNSCFFGYPYNTEDRREYVLSAVERTIRGGSWMDSQAVVRATCRDAQTPNSKDSSIGFRIAF